jgi:hypothetical protein
MNEMFDDFISIDESIHSESTTNTYFENSEWYSRKLFLFEDSYEDSKASVIPKLFLAEGRITYLEKELARLYNIEDKLILCEKKLNSIKNLNELNNDNGSIISHDQTLLYETKKSLNEKNEKIIFYEFKIKEYEQIVKTLQNRGYSREKEIEILKETVNDLEQKLVENHKVTSYESKTMNDAFTQVSNEIESEDNINHLQQINKLNIELESFKKQNFNMKLELEELQKSMAKGNISL